MEVSSVCASVFSAIEQPTEPLKNENDSPLNTFTSVQKSCDFNTDMNSIYEWKNFCQGQIMANNLDYIA